MDRQAGFAPNDLWLLKATTGVLFEWSEVLTSGTTPPQLYHHSAVAGTASGNDVMIIFGGSDATLTLTNGLYVLDLNSKNWTERSPANPPTARNGHTAVWAAELAKMLVTRSEGGKEWEGTGRNGKDGGKSEGQVR